MKGKIIKKCITGAVIYGLCELWYQTGKARILAVFIEGGYITMTELTDLFETTKVWPATYILHITKLMAEQMRERRSYEQESGNSKDAT